MNPVRTFLIKTFGCKTNHIDSEKTAGFLMSSGWRLSPENPGVCIVNSCCVTGRSEKKALKAALKFKKRFPFSKVFLSGCITRNLREEAGNYGIPSLSPPTTLMSKVGVAAGYPRYFLKIQNGCNNFCSYCVVPYLRGRSKSFDFKSIIKELEEIKKISDPAEVVVSGINIMDYRWEGLSLIDLLCEIAGKFNFRIRLSSLSLPFENGFVEKIAQIQGISPHFHISLQSGSNRVLRKMFRKYSVEQFIGTVKEIRNYFKNPAITTDVIFGFPGETDEDFEATLDVMKRVGFSRTHVFPYSSRPGTAAYLYEYLPSHKMKQRKKRLLDAAKKSADEYKRKFIEHKLSVVVEKREKDFFYGTSENYLKVKFKPSAGITEPGRIAKVSITGTAGEFLIGIT